MTEFQAEAEAGTDERGAALVEFALIMPLLFMLIFATITGAIAYDRNLAVSYSAQQTARYASTLSLLAFDESSQGGDANDTVQLDEADAWLAHVAEHVQSNSERVLTADAPGRHICVAFVPGTEDDAVGFDNPRRLLLTTSDTPTPADYSSTACVDDEIDTDIDPGHRVQVRLQRDDEIDLVLFGTIDIDLSKQAVSRYEVDLSLEAAE
ncbi:MAG: TadE family protein [Acidimicrobiales bacterium]|nr:TadE family protein [Acidimicrobiales bacterium]